MFFSADFRCAVNYSNPEFIKEYIQKLFSKYLPLANVEVNLNLKPKKTEPIKRLSIKLTHCYFDLHSFDIIF